MNKSLAVVRSGLPPGARRFATNVLVSKKRGQPAVNDSYSIRDETIVNWRKQRKEVARHKQSQMPRFENNIQVLPERAAHAPRSNVDERSYGATSSTSAVEEANSRQLIDDFFFLDARYVGVRDELTVQPQLSSTLSHVPGGASLSNHANEAIRFQQKFLRCQTSVDVLQLVSDNLSKLDGVNLSTALHRIAKFGGGHLVSDSRLEQLLTKIGHVVHGMDGQGVSLILWSLAKLQVSPAWLDNALTVCQNKMSDFSVHQICSLAYALPKLANLGAVGGTKIEQVSTQVVRELERNVDGITSPQDIIYATSSFVRFGVHNQEFFARIADNSLKAIDSFNENSMCSLLWSYASARFVDQELFAAGRSILERAPLDQAHNLSMFVWALSITHQADKNIYDILWPKFQKLFTELDTKSVCGMFWSYDNANLLTSERLKWFGDNVDVGSMTGEEICKILPAYSSTAESDKNLEFLAKLEARIDHIFAQLSPAQVAVVARCFGGEMPARTHRTALVQRLEKL